MFNKPNSMLILCVGVCGLLTGCDTVKTQLGLERKTPDEFSVMQRAPLEIPENLATLPVPTPGAPRPQDTTAKQQAKKVILGDSAPSITSPETSLSEAEQNLLQQAGATESQPTIRRVVSQEAKDMSNDKRPVIDRLIGRGDEEPTASVVDAEAEAKRIKEARERGQPITTGETPTLD
jgi:hypothetical protein